jgi:pimeloyl-ACP methyl ester carboxylesterase
MAWVEDIINVSQHFERVSLLGYSMGGAVAVKAATEIENLEKLVLAASPCCVDMFGENVLRMIYENARMKNLLRGIGGYEEFKESFIHEFIEIEPRKWIDRIEVPKLIVHGREDYIVPFENALTLFELAKEPKTFIELKKGNHFLRQDLAVSELIANWLLGKIKDRKLII